MFNDNWDKTKERFEALWRRERAGRPSVSIRILKEPMRPPEYMFRQSPEYLRRYFTDGQYILDMQKERRDKLYFLGDAFDSVNLYLGTSGHCAYTKKYRYRFEPPFTVWFGSTMEDIAGETIEYDDDSDLLGVTRRVLECMINAPGRDFLISNTDNYSSLDALASLRGTENLLADMVLEPKHVERHIQALQEILHRTESEFFPKQMAVNGGGTVTDWMQLWCPGKHHQLQCDLSVMISPEMFARFAMPELEQNAEWFGHTVYHFDGQEQIRHLDMLLSIKRIDLIQWTPVSGQPDTVEFIEVLKRIQKAGKGLVLMPHAYEMPKLLDALSPAGVHYLVRDLSTLKEANDMLALIEKKSG
jgi:hypothetical protein